MSEAPTVSYIEANGKEIRVVPQAPVGLNKRLEKAKGVIPFNEYRTAPDGSVAEYLNGTVLAVVLALYFTLISCAKDMDFGCVVNTSELDKDTALKGMLLLYSHGLIAEIDYGIGLCFYRFTPNGEKLARAVAALVNKRVRMYGSEGFDPFEFVKGLSARFEGTRLVIDYDLSKEGAVE